MAQNYLVAGDIGGTNSRLAIYLGPTKEGEEGNEPEFKNVLLREDYSNFEYVKKHGDTAFNHMLNDFLEKAAKKVAKCCFLEVGGGCQNCKIAACFACAGPIMNNACEFTNIDHEANVKFVIRGDDIKQATEGYQSLIKECKIINDFVGQGYGCLDIDLKEEAIELIPGSRDIIDPVGPKVCVGAGTGLGECFLTTSSLNPGSGYECFPSEGGHVEYAPRNELEVKLWMTLKKKFQHHHRISVERIVSGKGIANVYEFLAAEFPGEIESAVHEQFLEAGDLQGKVVGDNVREGNLCDKAMHIFMGTYGSEVGCCALKWIPRGGIYVTGGIIGKVLKANPHYVLGEDSEFMKAFFDKGRVSPILKDIPLFAVTVEDMGLRGARVCALRVLKSYLSTL